MYISEFICRRFSATTAALTLQKQRCFGVKNCICGFTFSLILILPAAILVAAVKLTY